MRGFTCAASDGASSACLHVLLAHRGRGHGKGLVHYRV